MLTATKLKAKLKRSLNCIVYWSVGWHDRYYRADEGRLINKPGAFVHDSSRQAQITYRTRRITFRSCSASQRAIFPTRTSRQAYCLDYYRAVLPVGALCSARRG